MICAKCYNDCDFDVKKENEIISVKGESIEILSNITYCKKCGEKVWNPVLDDENLKEAYKKYKMKHHLLLADEIKSIRMRLGISQKTFSTILGLGEKTITRYENGSIQDQAHNNLILLAGNINNFEKLYENTKEKLSASEQKKVKETLNKYKVKVVENNYKSFEVDSSYFGGFNNGETEKQYKFENAVLGL